MYLNELMEHCGEIPQINSVSLELLLRVRLKGIIQS